MRKGCTSQSRAAGSCGEESKESCPLPRMPTGQKDMQSRLFFINPFANSPFCGALPPASISDLPGPHHLTDAHQHSHHATMPPAPGRLCFLSFSPCLSRPPPPKEPVFRICAELPGLPEPSSPSRKPLQRARSSSAARAAPLQRQEPLCGLMRRYRSAAKPQ